MLKLVYPIVILMNCLNGASSLPSATPPELTEDDHHVVLKYFPIGKEWGECQAELDGTIAKLNAKRASLQKALEILGLPATESSVTGPTVNPLLVGTGQINPLHGKRPNHAGYAASVEPTEPAPSLEQVNISLGDIISDLHSLSKARRIWFDMPEA